MVTYVSTTSVEVIVRVERLLLRLLKHQSPLPMTVLLMTTLMRTIRLQYHMLPPGSNHLLYQSCVARLQWNIVVNTEWCTV